ncbi:Imm1 family immunity protein [Actinokineospora sp. 24-640]
MTTLAFWHSPDQHNELLATTPAEIDAALALVNRLSTDYGNVTTITRHGDVGPALYVGLNGDVGALQYTHANEAFFSQGNTRHGGTCLEYDWQWNIFHYPPDAEIPLTDIRTAVHQFAETGTKPTSVRWQEWEPPIEPGGTPLAYDDPAWG